MPDSFRGNTNLRLGDDRFAFVGAKTIVGINKLDKVDQFQWRPLGMTNGETDPKIPRPSPYLNMSTIRST